MIHSWKLYSAHLWNIVHYIWGELTGTGWQNVLPLSSNLWTLIDIWLTFTSKDFMYYLSLQWTKVGSVQETSPLCSTLLSPPDHGSCLLTQVVTSWPVTLSVARKGVLEKSHWPSDRSSSQQYFEWSWRIQPEYPELDPSLGFIHWIIWWLQWQTLNVCL